MLLYFVLNGQLPSKCFGYVSITVAPQTHSIPLNGTIHSYIYFVLVCVLVQHDYSIYAAVAKKFVF